MYILLCMTHMVVWRSVNSFLVILIYLFHVHYGKKFHPEIIGPIDLFLLYRVSCPK